MMGSAATKAASAQRAADSEAFRKAKLDLKLQKIQAGIDADRLKLDAKIARSGAKTDRIDAGSSVLLTRASTESQSILAPAQADAAVASSDAGARATLIRALPWIIGGVVVIGGIAYLRKRRGRSA